MAEQQRDHDDEGCLGCDQCSDKIKKELSKHNVWLEIEATHPSTWAACFLLLLTVCLASAIVVLCIERSRADNEDITIKCFEHLKHISQFALNKNATRWTKVPEVPDDDFPEMTSPRAITAIAT